MFSVQFQVKLKSASPQNQQGDEDDDDDIDAALSDLQVSSSMDAYGWLLNSYSGFLEKILIPFKQPKTKKDNNYRVLNYLEHLTSNYVHAL